MKTERKRANWQRILWWILMVSLVGSIIYVSIVLATAPAEPGAALPHERLKSDYVLMLVECFLGIAALILPGVLLRRFSIQIPSGMMVMYIIFLYCAVYLGEVRSFYYAVPRWDTYLHAFSGGMLGALGFSAVNFLNKTDRVKLTPAFVAVFALCFAVMLGVVWEIYEFTIDGVMGLNMQKYAVDGGELLVGRPALLDTMKDLITDIIGAGVMAVVGYISLKYDKGWMEKMLLRRTK